MYTNGGSPMTTTAPASALAVLGRAVRVYWPLVALVTLAAVAGTVWALSRREPDYRATAQILITPLPGYDKTFLGIDVLRDSGDAPRTAQTAAALLKSSGAAPVVARKLGPGWTAERVAADVTVEPQGESNVLGVTARANDPALAARAANEFAQAAISIRSRRLGRQLAARIPRLQARRRSLPMGDERGGVVDQIQALESIRLSGKDPSLSLLQPAAPPAKPSGPSNLLILALSVPAGLALGSFAAAGLALLNRRIGDEAELLRLYPLPVLARIPPLPRRLRRRGSVAPHDMPPAAREAFRTLRAQLEQRGGSRRSLMVASASSGDGKTTAAVNLATALVDADYSVILMDFDLRKPELGRMTGAHGQRGFAPILTSDTNLPELLVESPATPGLRVLGAAEGDVAFLEALVRRLPDILGEAKQMADFVVLDTAPLGEVSDALRVAAQIDDIVLVARPGNTNRHSFEQVRDLLERSGARPTGLLITGQALPASSSYYTYGASPAAKVR